MARAGYSFLLRLNFLQIPLWGDSVGGNNPIAANLEFQTAAIAEIGSGLSFAEFIGGDDAQALASFANWTVHKKTPPLMITFSIGGICDKSVMEAKKNYEIEEIIGKVKKKVAPLPGGDSAPTSPPWASTICFTMARPSPVPPLPRVRAPSAL